MAGSRMILLAVWLLMVALSLSCTVAETVTDSETYGAETEAMVTVTVFGATGPKRISLHKHEFQANAQVGAAANLQHASNQQQHHTKRAPRHLRRRTKGQNPVQPTATSPVAPAPAPSPPQSGAAPVTPVEQPQQQAPTQVPAAPATQDTGPVVIGMVVGSGAASSPAATTPTSPNSEVDDDEGQSGSAPADEKPRASFSKVVDSLPLLNGKMSKDSAGYLSAGNGNGSEPSGFLYFYLARSRKNSNKDPLLLWLNGGPGSSSLLGLFLENGPYSIKEANGNPNEPVVEENPHSWNNNANILYIDQPVGTGFSTAGSDDKPVYAQNEDDVSTHLLNGLIQFTKLHPEFKGRDFFIAGESYAGVYLPFLAAKYHKFTATNKKVGLPKLVGLALGDAWVEPSIHNQGYAEFAWANGFVDLAQKEQGVEMEKRCIELIKAKDWGPAGRACDGYLHFLLQSGGDFCAYDIRKFHDYNFKHVENYLNRPDVKAALHGFGKWTEDNAPVEKALAHEIQMGSAALIPDLLKDYRLMFFNGQFDFICNAPAMEMYLSQINWSGKDAFNKSPRVIWRGTEKDQKPGVRGYVKEHGNLVFVVVHSAGHMVPMDMPHSALDMIERFMNGKSFTDDASSGDLRTVAASIASAVADQLNSAASESNQGSVASGSDGSQAGPSSPDSQNGDSNSTSAPAATNTSSS